MTIFIEVKRCAGVRGGVLFVVSDAVLDLLQRVEDDAHVAFEIRDDLRHVLRVRDDFNALVVRIVANCERPFDRQCEFSERNEATCDGST